MASYRIGKKFAGRHVWINGYNGAGAATEEDIWDYSAVWTPIVAAGVLLEVGSDAAVDDVGNTGATGIRVYGLGPAGQIQSEDFAMDGQTPVLGTKTWYRVWGAEVTSAGTGTTNAGTIYIADSATAWVAGVPSTASAIQATIAVGIAVTRLGWWTPPANRSAWIRDIFIGNATAAATYLVKVREYGDATWKTEASFYMAATQPEFATPRLKDFCDIPPMADVRVTVTGNTAIANVVVHFETN